MKSKTPETDAFVAHMAEQFQDPAWIEFAQRLELQLGQAIDQIERDAGQPGSFARCEKLERENANLHGALKAAILELDRVNTVKDGHPLVSHNLLYNLRQLCA
jgi:hypothetical protein